MTTIENAAAHDAEKKGTKAGTSLGFVATRRIVEIVLTLVLGIGAGLLFYGADFGLDMVHSQLSAQAISFPAKGSPALDPKEFPGLQQYAGQKVDDGPKAKAYANEFIATHLNAAAGGQDLLAGQREGPGGTERHEARGPGEHAVPRRDPPWPAALRLGLVGHQQDRAVRGDRCIDRLPPDARHHDRRLRRRPQDRRSPPRDRGVTDRPAGERRNHDH